MATFAAAKAAQPRPLRIVTLEPSAWVVRPPKAKVAIGLRCLSESEVMTAQAEAWKEARQGEREGEALIERFNEALMCWVVGAAATDPNNANKPYFEFADVEVRTRLSSAAIRFLWDELELAQASVSPLIPPANDDQLAELGALLCGENPLGELAPSQALRIRRWSTVLLNLLSPSDP